LSGFGNKRQRYDRSYATGQKEFYYKKLGLIAPGGRPTAGLKRYADFNKNIDNGDLAVAQFSNPIKRLLASDIFKPSSW